MSKFAEDFLSNDYTEIKDWEILNGYPNTHGLEFKEEDLDKYVKDTNELIEKGLVDPNISISHSDQQIILKEIYKMADVEFLEEIPNLGLIHNLRRSGKGILADVKQVPSKLKDIIYTRKLFTSLSPTLINNWRETGKNIIRAVALSNIPSMKHVPDVHMSEGLMYRGNLTIEDGGHNMGDNEKILETMEKTIDSKLEKHSEGLMAKLSEWFKKEKPLEVPIVKKKSDETMVTLSEVQALQAEWTKKFDEQLNALNLQLVKKDESFVQLSEDVKKQGLETKKKQAELICKTAGLAGVPALAISKLKPILLSEEGERVIQFSQKVDEKEVVVKSSIASIIEDFFVNYPNKVDMSEATRTDLSSPSDDKQKQVEQRAKELIAEGKNKHEALTIAGREILGG